LEEESAGVASTALGDGKTAAMFYLYVTSGSRAFILKSRPFHFSVGPPLFSDLSEAERKKFIVRLLARFDKDAWSGREAFEAAVAVGGPVLEQLISAAREKDRPEHSRLWLTAAVGSIRDERAIKALVALLDDPAVRTVVAYHGPKQGSAELDRAITARAERLKNPHFTAYAIMGYIAFARKAPPQLLKLGLDSKDARTRGAAIASLREKGGGPLTLQALAAALRDKDQGLRASAARVLGHIGNNSRNVIRALATALDLEGDSARLRICESLGKLTGQDIPYPVSGTPAQKKAVIEKWKKWCMEMKK
jgi:HEAT repeat protein